MDIKKIFNKIPDQVQWHEGMLLSSQHLQASDSFFCKYINLLSRSGNYFNYGILDLKIDDSELSSLHMKILNIQAIMQDGTIVKYNSDESETFLEKDLSKSFEKKNNVKIYLAVLRHEDGENNFTKGIARYSSEIVEDVKDENTGTNPIELTTKRVKIYLLEEEELNPKYVYFPIIELKKTNSGLQKTDYIPPTLFITNDSYLKEFCISILKIVKQRIGYIISKKKLIKDNKAIESALRSLITNSIPLDAILNVKYVTPFEIYKEFLHLAAALISFSVSNVVPLLMSYDHENLLIVFKSLEEHIVKSLNQIVEFSSAIPFSFVDGIFRLKLLHEWNDIGELLIGIRKSDTVKKDDFITWVNGAQITSESFLNELKQKRVLGASRVYKHDEDVGFENLEEDMLIIGIDARSSYVKFGEDLCIFNSSFNIVPEEVMFFKKESK